MDPVNGVLQSTAVSQNKPRRKSAAQFFTASDEDGWICCPRLSDSALIRSHNNLCHCQQANYGLWKVSVQYHKKISPRSVGAILSHSIMIMLKPRTSCWSLTNFTNVTLCLGTTIKFDYVANKPTAWTVLLFVASQNSAAHGFVSCTTSAIEGKIGLNWSWCSYNATLRGNLSWWAHKWVGGS